MKHIHYFLLILICTALACKPEKDGNGNTKLSPDAINNPISASGKDSKKNLPAFEFIESNHSFGTVMAGEVKTHIFEFTNVGTADLIINDVSSSCSCTVPEFTKEPVPPKGKGSIKVVFSSKGRSGMNSKNITVVANTIPNTKVLTINADVIAN